MPEHIRHDGIRVTDRSKNLMSISRGLLVFRTNSSTCAADRQRCCMSIGSRLLSALETAERPFGVSRALASYKYPAREDLRLIWRDEGGPSSPIKLAPEPSSNFRTITQWQPQDFIDRLYRRAPPIR
jgi:hypothetical protein